MDLKNWIFGGAKAPETIWQEDLLKLTKKALEIENCG